jgi:lysozyme
MSRIQIAALSLSASALVGIAVHEGYRGEAYEPVKGDVPTIGFGTTEGVEMGDRITPERALVRLLQDASKFEKAVKRCAPVPMYSYEFDSYVSLTYNIGEGAFCKSTMAKLLKEQKYEEACKQILRWDRFKGKPLPGLTKRRQEEYQKCLGY